ncbi:MAG: hypothetical protein GY764_02345 [Halieaceae bacterium]|jgi:hypothetical protein|nr:hypothetical protein [Halieaceae bacterium]MCP4466148.1 hypothetical protein [Halieaceae bacterium]
MKFCRTVLGSLIFASLPVFAQIADSALPGSLGDAPATSAASPSETSATVESSYTQVSETSGSDADEMSRAERKRQVIRGVLEDAKAQPDYTPTAPPPTNRYDDIAR